MSKQTTNYGLYLPDAGEGSKQNPIAAELNSNWQTIDAELGGGAEKLHIQNTAPSNPSDGDVWINTS